MKLPSDLFDPEVQGSVEIIKNLFGSQAITMCLQTKERGGSVIGSGALVTQALLDAALDHFVLWHHTQGLELDEPQLLAFISQRLEIARAIVASRCAPCSEMRQ